MDTRTQTIVNALAEQRDMMSSQLSNIIAQLRGDLAEWDERWNDLEAVTARAAELKPPEVT